MSLLSKRARLRSRWYGEDARRLDILADLSRGADWTARLRRDPGGRWDELAYSSEIPSVGGEAAGRDLRGIHLRGARLRDTNGLADTRFDYASLESVDFEGLNFVNCTFVSARIFGHSSLQGANFSQADFHGARVEDASFSGALFAECDLYGARFDGCSIRAARFQKVRFVGSRWTEALLPGKCFRMRGDDISGRVIHDESDEFVRRFLDEEADMWALERQRPLVARFWRALTSDGRSLSRLFGWVIFVWLFFGWLYAGAPVPATMNGKAVASIRSAVTPRLKLDERQPSRFTPFYFSAMTLTTVGFGDVTPDKRDWYSELLPVLEALLGVIGWGCLVTILFQTFPRRMG